MAKGPTREWVMFDDPEEDGRTWQVDVTFLLSSWDCIFGSGCQGVLTEPSPELVQGCCSYGAHFSDRPRPEDGREAGEEAPGRPVAVREDRPEEGHLGQAREARGRPRLAHPARRRRVHLLESSGMEERPRLRAAPVGHAHRNPPQRAQARGLLAVAAASSRRGASRRSVISKLTEFGRDGWGEGGEEFCWWCTEAPEAFVGKRARLPLARPRSCASCSGEVCTSGLPRTSTTTSKAQPAPVVHPAEVKLLAREAAHRTAVDELRRGACRRRRGTPRP